MADESMTSPIDLNQADVETLCTLPGIGPALAARIIEFREEEHSFAEAKEVVSVPGISKEMYNQFAARVIVAAAGSDDVRDVEEVSDNRAVETAADPFPAVGPENPEPEAVAGKVDEVDASTEADTLAQVGAPHQTETPPPSPRLANVPPQKASATGGSNWRLWIVAIIAAVGGAILALLILHSINGTLNMGSHPQVLRLSNEVAALQRRGETLNTEIEQLRERLNRMEALSGRLQQAEAELESLSETLRGLNEQVAALEETMEQTQSDIHTLGEGLSNQRAQIAALEEDTAEIRETMIEIQAAADRFDGFLTGLRDLLMATEETAEPPDGTTPSPTPSDSSARPATSTPTTTPADAPTPLLRPTLTPPATVAVDTPSASYQTSETPDHAVSAKK